MAQIEIYTLPLCGYCHAAKRLLRGKGAKFTEIDISDHPERKPEQLGRGAAAFGLRLELESNRVRIVSYVTKRARLPSELFGAA